MLQLHSNKLHIGEQGRDQRQYHIEMKGKEFPVCCWGRSPLDAALHLLLSKMRGKVVQRFHIIALREI